MEARLGMLCPQCHKDMQAHTRQVSEFIQEIEFYCDPCQITRTTRLEWPKPPELPTFEKPKRIIPVIGVKKKVADA